MSTYLLLIFGMVIYYVQYVVGVLDGTPLECPTHDDSRDYMGTNSLTETGQECQSWVEQTTNDKYHKDELFPDITFAAAVNYCRNPKYPTKNKHDQQTWCYPLSGNPTWQWCTLPERCPDCKEDMMGSSYSGTVSSTSCGITCQRWDSQSPHPHTYTEHTYFPDSTLQFVENYCRNPGNSRAAPWCYTTDDAVEWEYCNVDLCENPEGGSLCGVNLDQQATTVGVQETTIPLTEPLEPITAAEGDTAPPGPGNAATEPAGDASEPAEGVTGNMAAVTNPEGGETDAAEGGTHQMGELATEPIGGATQHGVLVTEPAEVATQSGGLVSEPEEGATRPGELVSELIGAATEPVDRMLQTDGPDNTEHVADGTNAVKLATESAEGTAGQAVRTEPPEHGTQDRLVTYVPSIQPTGKAKDVGNTSDINQTSEQKEHRITHEFDKRTTTTTDTTAPRTTRKSTNAATMIETTNADNEYDEDYYETEKAEENDLLPIYLVIGAVAFELSIAIPCFIMYFKKAGTIKPAEA